MDMKIMDFNYGKSEEYKEFKEGKIASHPLYGMIEIENAGYEVKHISMSKKNGLKGIIANTKLILKARCNILFCSYIYIFPLLGIVFLKRLGFCKKLHIVGVCHTNFHEDYSFVYRFICRFVYRSFDHIFFHSPKNMLEATSNHYVEASKMSVLHWGIDLNFLYYHNVLLEAESDKHYISTGKEYRDFNILIDAFAGLDSKLNVYTNVTNYENNYDFLVDYIDKYKNIDINLVEKNQYNYNQFIDLVAKSYCVVIPLMKNHCYYCLGHTSIVEALALGKPIIVSENEYHSIDVEKCGVGLKIRSFEPEEWKRAINYLSSHEMVVNEMSKKALKLAKEKYNIEVCAKEILSVILQF
jgi:glycosyltransferase involved in cell wall biosynthesis